MNPIFSDTNGNIEVASKASDIYSASESDDSEDSDEGNETNTCMNTVEEQSNLPDAEFELENAVACSSTVSEQGSEQKSSKRGNMKPRSLSSSKRIRTYNQVLQQIAKNFNVLHESQKDRAQMILDLEKQVSEEFLKFRREQAELNRQHELKLMEMILKYNSQPAQAQAHAQPFRSVQYTFP